MAGPLRDLHFGLSTVPMIHRLGALWYLLNMAREDPYHKHEVTAGAPGGSRCAYSASGLTISGHENFEVSMCSYNCKYVVRYQELSTKKSSDGVRLEWYF